MFELTTVIDFEAAHCIPGYPGKCQRLHGHNWRVEVTVRGRKLNQLGMLIDFKELKNEVNTLFAGLDHYYLNDLEPFKKINPTAENIAKYIYDELSKNPVFDDNLKISSIQVWESPHSAVRYMQEAD